MAEIEIRNLGFRYDESNQTLGALEDVSLHIHDGEFICVIGRSGCGKTTLLRLIAGLHPATTGEIRIDGSIVERPGTNRSIVFQNYTLFPWMTARKNVQFGIREVRSELLNAEIMTIADEFLQKVDMLVDADKYPYQLSGGMRQRVAIARALAMDTDILLLDEPFGALDAKIRGELQLLLEELWNSGNGRRKTVVFVTHDINEAVLLADRIIFMQPGRISADIAVDIPRPRGNPSQEAARSMKELRDELLVLFYKDGDMRGAEMEDANETSD